MGERGRQTNLLIDDLFIKEGIYLIYGRRKGMEGLIERKGELHFYVEVPERKDFYQWGMGA